MQSHEAADNVAGKAEAASSPPQSQSAGTPSVQAVLALQRLAGNAAVSSMLARRKPAEPVVLQRLLGSPRFVGDATLLSVDAGTATLSRGDTGPPVRKVQHAIHDSGLLFKRRGVNGTFNAETERLVTSFQRGHHVTGDAAGVVGGSTLRALDTLFPAMALPATAGLPYTFGGMKAVLCQWNAALIQDLRNLNVRMVDRLEWLDERFDGSRWVSNPMSGSGETTGTTIIVATNDTSENVARALYHEYQHARSPLAYRSRTWADEETRAYEMETYWAIDRGLTPDPSLTTTDPSTGAVTMNPGGVSSTVTSYPGLGGAHPGEVIAKVGATRVRVRMPNGRITVRAAVAGDTVPGPRHVVGTPHRVRDAEWRC